MRKLLAIFLLLIPFAGGAQADPDAAMRRAGLVDVTTIDSTLQVRLMYATADNFVGRNMYGTLREAYLHPEFARMLAAAQADLRRTYPDYSLLVLDAARPMSAQRTMFRLVAGTPKNIYVANPAKGGGRHNYGAAVDVTILDASGRELDMGTKVDHFGPEAHVGLEAELVRQGKITAAAAANRALLRGIMTRAGFSGVKYEWWHFHKYSVAQLQQKYTLLDF
ncbi:MAG: M15 family metallopeptidase [Rikenellaceae bacterium]|jgi:D-alanyl-D-alanine dipeptidase|nr:M15 family metallopeptidase [Rikenellaceae bacterium]